MSIQIDQDSSDYLRFIINEDLYIIQESQEQYKNKVTATNTKTIEPVQVISKPPVSLTKKIYKVGIVAGSENEITSNKEFIAKMLQAIGINWEEAFAISSKQEDLSNFESFLVFGINHQTLVPYTSPVNLNQSLIQGNQKFIFTYPLAELEGNKEKKMALWKAMQETYSIKK